MFKPHSITLALAVSLLAGCQAVNTTSGGAVGVERKQYMFSMLSTEQVNQMYAQSYQETLSEASSKGVLEKSSAIDKRVDAIAKRLIAQVSVFRPDAAQWELGSQRDRQPRAQRQLRSWRKDHLLHGPDREAEADR